jgi:hypothetical protein
LLQKKSMGMEATEGLGVKYDGQSVRSIRCHKLVADSLGQILGRISDSPTD